VIDRLRELCVKLLAPDLSAEDAAKLFGRTTDMGPLSIDVSPSDSAFRTAAVVRGAGGSGISHVELALEEPSAVEELTSAFGTPSTPVRLHAQDAASRIYRVGNCRVIASLDNDGRVTSIILQPDA